MYRGGGGNRGNYRNYRGGSRGGKPTPTTTPPTQKGLFADGIWQCNCTPRLPAEHFKVKKEGKNQGRWFYTCQNSEPKRCGFFLWDEDARPREEAAVLSGRRTEPGGRISLGGSGSGRREVQEGWDAGRAARAARTDAMGARGGVVGRGRRLFAQSANTRVNTGRIEEDEETPSPSPKRISPPPPYTAIPATNAAKRKAQQANLDSDDDEAFPWPLTGQEEQALAQTADPTTAPPQTPHKAQKIGVYATPATTGGRKLPWLQQPQTPQTPSTTTNSGLGYLDTPSKTAGTTAAAAGIPQTTPTPQQTPNPPTRHKPALLPLTSSSDSPNTLTTTIPSVLEPLNLPPDILATLHRTLTTHDLQTAGIRKGRDLAREAVRAKEERVVELEATVAGLEATVAGLEVRVAGLEGANTKIAELRSRVAGLEAEREVLKGVVGELRGRVGRGYDGGGGGVGGFGGRGGGGDGEGYDSQETIV